MTRRRPRRAVCPSCGEEFTYVESRAEAPRCRPCRLDAARALHASIVSPRSLTEDWRLRRAAAVARARARPVS